MALTTRRSDRALEILNAFHQRPDGEVVFTSDPYWQRKVAALAERQAVLEDELGLIALTSSEAAERKAWFWSEIITFAPAGLILAIFGTLGFLTVKHVIPWYVPNQDFVIVGLMLIGPYAWMMPWIIYRARESERLLEKAQLKRQVAAMLEN